MELAKKINRVAKLSGTFQLRSGAISDTYFDKYQFESDPEILLHIAKEMSKLIPEGTEVLAGLEMGGIPVVTMLSQVSGIPAAFIRKEAKPYGTCRYAEGTSLQGKKVTLVEDVVSSGGAILDAAKMMREDGVAVTVALCVIDRETGGLENLQAAGISLVSVLTRTDLDQHQA